jgi:hypothetical protein
VAGCHSEAQKGDQTICGNGGNSTGRDEGREGDIGGQDGAENNRAEDVDDPDGVTWLAIRRHASNPSGQREHTITGDGVYKTRSCDDGNAGVLNCSFSWKETTEYQTYNDQSNSGQDRHENGTAISKSKRVELDKRLGCKQPEERVKVGGAVEEYDHR